MSVDVDLLNKLSREDCLIANDPSSLLFSLCLNMQNQSQSRQLHESISWYKTARGEPDARPGMVQA